MKWRTVMTVDREGVVQTDDTAPNRVIVQLLPSDTGRVRLEVTLGEQEWQPLIELTPGDSFSIEVHTIEVTA